MERPSSKQVSYPVVISLPPLTRRTIRAWRTSEADHRDIHKRHGALGEDHTRGEDVREEYRSAVRRHGLDLANGRSISIVEGESLVHIAMEDGMSAAIYCLRILLRLFYNPPWPTWPECARDSKSGTLVVETYIRKNIKARPMWRSNMPVDFNSVSSTYRLIIELFVGGLEMLTPKLISNFCKQNSNPAAEDQSVF